MTSWGCGEADDDISSLLMLSIRILTDIDQLHLGKVIALARPLRLHFQNGAET